MTRMNDAPAPTLNAARIEALFRAGGNAAAVDIRTVASTGSTNADLMAAAQAGALIRPTLLAAQMQTAGRGRAGRAWLSAPDAALTFSLAWKFDCPLQHLAGLPLAVGVTLAEALAALGQAVQLKWPNDLLLDHAKLGGILIEIAGGTQSRVGGDATWAVIGIGLNLALPAALREQVNGASATALLALEREQLLAVLLDRLADALTEFERAGFAAFTARWNACHAYADRAVRILDQGQILHQGIAAGVDDGGRLLLDTDSGRIAISAGDVSLRLMDGD
ncbi:biotin--[acetyl-CoA-carboxylase] ligase [Oxalobacteraceae bacterium CAVE-383]|nr:biotin--[acetyl-CoA-carboxylase] ligase [Oxalobacteraceae bacterium CAVE-383]